MIFRALSSGVLPPRLRSARGALAFFSLRIVIKSIVGSTGLSTASTVPACWQRWGVEVRVRGAAARARASVTRPGTAHAETVPAPRAPVASVRRRHHANQMLRRGSMTLREAAAAAAVVVTAPSVPAAGGGDVSTRALALLSPPARTRREYVLDLRSFATPDMTVQSVGRVLSVAVHSAARSAGADAAGAVAMAMAVAGVSRAQVYRNLTTAETAQRAGVNPGEALKSRQGLHDKTRAAKKMRI